MKMKRQEKIYTKIYLQTHPLGNMNICTQFHCKPSNRWIKVLKSRGKLFNSQDWDRLPSGPPHCTCWEGSGPGFHSLDGQPSSSQPAWRNRPWDLKALKTTYFLNQSQVRVIFVISDERFLNFFVPRWSSQWFVTNRLF